MGHRHWRRSPHTLGSERAAARGSNRARTDLEGDHDRCIQPRHRQSSPRHCVRFWRRAAGRNGGAHPEPSPGIHEFASSPPRPSNGNGRHAHGSCGRSGRRRVAAGLPPHATHPPPQPGDSQASTTPTLGRALRVSLARTRIRSGGATSPHHLPPNAGVPTKLCRGRRWRSSRTTPDTPTQTRQTRAIPVRRAWRLGSPTSPHERARGVWAGPGRITSPCHRRCNALEVFADFNPAAALRITRREQSPPRGAGTGTESRAGRAPV